MVSILDRRDGDERLEGGDREERRDVGKKYVGEAGDVGELDLLREAESCDSLRRMLVCWECNIM